MIHGLLESADIFGRVINTKDLKITPWEQDRLQPASYEMALGSRFLYFNSLVNVIDPLALENYTLEANIDDDEQPWYDAGYYSRSPDRNPQGPTNTGRRASRGGSWRHHIKVARTAARSSIPPEFQYTDYGFRVARSSTT